MSEVPLYLAPLIWRARALSRFNVKKAGYLAHEKRDDFGYLAYEEPPHPGTLQGYLTYEKTPPRRTLQ